ncbi:MAG: RluA family pseudouridine synthase, partial [Microcoleus sp.]
GDKIQGVFYGACADRCQPLMGFLLSGIVQHKSGTIGQIARSQPSQDLLSQTGLTQGIQSYAITSDSEVIAKAHFSSQVCKSDRIDETEFVGEHTSFQPAQLANNSVASWLCESYQLPIIYQDKWLIAINKPAELLSVPGRYFANQDSVQSRLQNLLPERGEVRAVHRLDLETSGILLLARDKATYRQVSGQFAQKQVRKVYEAVLSGNLKIDAGTIELPLWGNPENRPLQQVDWQYGKPSITRFQVIATEGNHTRIEFLPLTGRTHQLRVHAADARGLGMAILGDRLYGYRHSASRLHLHARELFFAHPHLGGTICLKVPTPF